MLLCKVTSSLYLSRIGQLGPAAIPAAERMRMTLGAEVVRQRQAQAHCKAFRCTRPFYKLWAHHQSHVSHFD